MSRSLHSSVFLCCMLCCAAGCGRAAERSNAQDLESTGVEACDGYVAKMVACAGKLPPEVRPGHDAAIQVARDALAAKASADEDALKGEQRKEALAALTTACAEMASALAERAECGR